MNLEHVSVESSQSHPHWQTPQNIPSTIIYRSHLETGCQERFSKADIDKILVRLSAKGLFAKEHVAAYLHDMYRRNCRLSTIRKNSCSIILFLCFLKDLGKEQLEVITREDISVFIEADVFHADFLERNPKSICQSFAQDPR